MILPAHNALRELREPANMATNNNEIGRVVVTPILENGEIVGFQFVEVPLEEPAPKVVNAPKKKKKADRRSTEEIMGELHSLLDVARKLEDTLKMINMTENMPMRVIKEEHVFLGKPSAAVTTMLNRSKKTPEKESPGVRSVVVDGVTMQVPA